MSRERLRWLTCLYVSPWSLSAAGFGLPSSAPWQETPTDALRLRGALGPACELLHAFLFRFADQRVADAT
jgi:hypothetical protein